MNKQIVLLAIGTRPEAIKMAPLILELRKNQAAFKTVVCVTAQHREMLDQVLNIFDIKPDYDLNLMQHTQTLASLTTRIINAFDEVISHVKPNLVLVHGDTTTALACALSAFYRGIKVAHIEAGLRTHDIRSPFPEEFNRQTIGTIATLHFAPTKVNETNLLLEGVDAEKIYVTGNTIVDAMKFILLTIEEKFNAGYPEFLKENLSFDFNNHRYILMTCHRRENIGTNLVNICEAVLEISRKFSDINIVLPVHMNPTVRDTVRSLLGAQKNICLIDPVEYLPFIYLMKHASIILTDSGGIQEEAPSLGKPVLLLRDTTERPEVVSTGAVELVGADKDLIISRLSSLLHQGAEGIGNADQPNPYGDGFAAKKIVSIMKEEANV